MTPRQEALLAGAKRYVTGKPCSRGHVAQRYCSSNGCVQCAAENFKALPREKKIIYEQKYVNQHRLKKRKRVAAYAATAKGKEAKARHYQKNKTRYSDAAMRRRENPETLESDRKRMRDSARANRPRENARAKAYTLTKKRNCPKWVSAEEKQNIAKFYETAAHKTRETGEVHHVDHIYPLRGKLCSGLHVSWNLQVITATENLRKGNREPKTDQPKLDNRSKPAIQASEASRALPPPN